MPPLGDGFRESTLPDVRNGLVIVDNGTHRNAARHRFYGLPAGVMEVARPQVQGEFFE